MRALSVPRLSGLFGLFALAVGSLACGEGPSRGSAASTGSGAALFATHCSPCHGKAGEGTLLGNDLRGTAQHWDAARLLEYIDDPKAFAEKDPRLGARPMTAVARDVTPQERAQIVEHALTLME